MHVSMVFFFFFCHIWSWTKPGHMILSVRSTAQEIEITNLDLTVTVCGHWETISLLSSLHLEYGNTRSRFTLMGAGLQATYRDVKDFGAGRQKLLAFWLIGVWSAGSTPERTDLCVCVCVCVHVFCWVVPHACYVEEPCTPTKGLYSWSIAPIPLCRI